MKATLAAQPLEESRDDAAPFRLALCETRRCLEVTLVGVWDMPTFERFACDYVAAVEALLALGDTPRFLFDASAFGMQEEGVAERFPPLIRSLLLPDTQRTACVIPSLVNRVQAREGADLANARYFRSRADASDWLFGDEA